MHIEKDPGGGTPIELAIFPLLMYCTSVICSGTMGYVYRRIGRKKTFTLGAFF